MGLRGCLVAFKNIVNILKNLHFFSASDNIFYLLNPLYYTCYQISFHDILKSSIFCLYLANDFIFDYFCSAFSPFSTLFSHQIILQYLIFLLRLYIPYGLICIFCLPEAIKSECWREATAEIQFSSLDEFAFISPLWAFL